ncbi:hypothetical protein PARPLA_02019 [Rhodobacteraceae bacterium THAF1]|nr:hypothetical protein PARPLA_02019 [Rhodobacteraceae bacterium THAF1]
MQRAAACHVFVRSKFHRFGNTSGGRRRGQSPLGIRRVEIRPAHRERVQPKPVCDLVHHAFDPDHTLRPTEAAKRCGRRGIGAQPVRVDARGGQVVGIVCVQHRAVGDGDRQVLAPAAAGELFEGDALHPASVIESHIVSDAEVVAFAGDDHVVVAVVTHFCGATGLRGDQCAGDGQGVALAFLATEPAAHAPHLDPHGVHRYAQRMRDLVLDLGRVLGR